MIIIMVITRMIVRVIMIISRYWVSYHAEPFTWIILLKYNNMPQWALWWSILEVRKQVQRGEVIFPKTYSK